MTLRKITIDHSVLYMPRNEQTQSVSRENKQNTKKIYSLARKQNKNLSQNIEKFVKNYITRKI